MPRAYYVIPDLYTALKAEGYTLPDDCGDITLEMPVDGMMQLILRINVTPELGQMIGRALVKLGEQHVKEGHT